MWQRRQWPCGGELSSKWFAFQATGTPRRPSACALPESRHSSALHRSSAAVLTWLLNWIDRRAKHARSAHTWHAHRPAKEVPDGHQALSAGCILSSSSSSSSCLSLSTPSRGWGVANCAPRGVLPLSGVGPLGDGGQPHAAARRRAGGLGRCGEGLLRTVEGKGEWFESGCMYGGGGFVGRWMGGWVGDTMGRRG